jgi:uncharacterized membrane protein
MFSNSSSMITFDPTWPWSTIGVGPEMLVIVALTLVVLTVWTYRDVRGATRRRVLVLIGLRLAALAVACLVVLRPSLAFHDEANLPSTLILAADRSESMTIQDQYAGQSRWDYLRRLLSECEPVLHDLLDEHHVTVKLAGFAGEVSEFDPNSRADGKRTDFGEMLHSLYDRHAGERNLRGLVILSDGADNGTRYPALSEAARWRALPCPIYTVGFGQTTTTAKQRDIAFTAITPEPSPVAIKGKLTVKALVDAPGYQGAHGVVLRLFINDQQVAMDDKVELPKINGNEVKISCDAPAEPGEVRVTLKIDPLQGEVTTANNEISTYLTVTKEGISVLYVEGKYRAWEPKFIRWALTAEPSIRLWESVRLNDVPGKDAELFNLDKQHYDVIIMGDVSARRFTAGNPRILSTIERLVTEKGLGLMMIGGYETFGNSDWQNTDLARVLPVQLNEAGQVDGDIQMVPTFDGLRHYILRLADNPIDNQTLWGLDANGNPSGKSKLPPLSGMTRLGGPKLGAIVLARTQNKEPLLVGEPSHGLGRTLAFGADTTWRWRRTPEGARAHARFWQQVVFWLAKRDEAGGNVLVLPDTRRLPAGSKLGFTVKLRGQGGVEIPPKDARFEVKVVAPDHSESPVLTAPENGEERGTFWKTDQPGEYKLVVQGHGKDTDGKPLEGLAPATARFLVYQDEAEMARQAADHDFLAKLASAGGGKFHQPEDLKLFLKELVTQPLPQERAKPHLWPDWRRTPPSRSVHDQAVTLARSGILACFLLFVLLLCAEWFLRRYWGLV